VSLRLTNQHAVEGITMKHRQFAQASNGSFIQSQRRDEMIFPLQGDILRGRLWQRQFAEAVFKGDFLERDYAQENLVLRVAHCGGDSQRQFGVATHQP